MIKNLIPALLLLASYSYGQVSNDTIYKDRYAQHTTKQDAVSYDVITDFKDNVRIIKTYDFPSQRITMEIQGIYNASDQQIVYTNMTYFTPTGEILNTIYFDQGEISKVLSIDPFTQETSETIFSNDLIYSGNLVVFEDDRYVYSRYNQGNLKGYEQVNVNNPKNKFVYFFSPQTTLTSTVYYDENANEIYTLIYDENLAPYSGHEVELNESGLGIYSIKRYIEGKEIETTSFYKDGKRKTTTTTGPTAISQITYDKKGNVIGSSVSNLDQLEHKNTDDGEFIYFDDSVNTDNITSIHKFSLGKAIWSKEYISTKDENLLFSQTHYEPSTENPTYTEYYNKKGKVIDRLDFKDGVAYHGTYYTPYETHTFENGVTISKTTFYDGTDKIFEKYEDLHSIYYDLNENILGELTYSKDTLGNVLPLQGTQYALFLDKVSSISLYENGLLTIFKTLYQDTKSTIGIIEQEVFNNQQGQYKVNNYYNNGQLQSSITYDPTRYYGEKQKAIYYTSQGKIIGEFDFQSRHGIEVEFFYDNHIQTIIGFDNGEILTQKTYARNWTHYSEDQTDNQYYLQADIDYNANALFYDQHGNILHQATYRNGAPYSGTTVLTESFEIVQTPYLNGLIDGDRFTYALYGSVQEMTKIETFNKGNKVKEQLFKDETLTQDYTYLNQMKNGISNFYDPQGNIKTTLIYKDNLPYQGTFTYEAYAYIQESIYEKGELVSLKRFSNDTGVLIYEQIQRAKNTYKRSVFDDQGALVFEYNLKNNELDGPCLIVTPNQTYQSELNQGYLQSGSILIQIKTNDQFNEENEEIGAKITYDDKKGIYSQTVIYLKTNETLYQATTQINKENKLYNPNTKNKIKPDDLLPFSIHNYIENENYDLL